MNDSPNYSAIDRKGRSADCDQLQKLFERRRSTRAYSDAKPDRDDIREIVSAARFAPNACNLQHYGFIYVDDDDTLEKLARTVTGKASWAPALIVVIDDSRFSRHRGAGLQGVAAAVQNMILMATAKGMGAVWMAGFRNDKTLREILNIPAYYDVTGLIGIGYAHPDAGHAPTVRLAVDDYLHFDGFQRKDAELLASTNVDDWPMEKLISYRNRIGSVYAPRKRIQLYHRDMVEEAAETLGKLVAGRGDDRRRLLDIATYDGCFVRALHGSGIDVSLTASDYSDYFLELIARQLPGTDTVTLSPGHVPAPTVNNPFDILSLVFKVEFLPRIDLLLSNLRPMVDGDGRLFVTTITAGTPRAISYRAKALVSRANVYERNPLYRFGPFRHRSVFKLQRLFDRTGWRIERKGKAGHWPRTGFSWWWLAPARTDHDSTQ